MTFTSALVHTDNRMMGSMVAHEAPSDGLERLPRSPMAVVTLGKWKDTVYTDTFQVFLDPLSSKS